MGRRRMRLGLVMLALPLAACASVEERTKARSGPGFTTTEAGPAQAQPAVTEVRMQGFEIVPKVTVQGGPMSVDDGARRAFAAGGIDSGAWVPFSSGGMDFSIRQVQAGGHDFAILEPVSRPAAADAGMLEQVRIRTGCLTTGRTWEEDGRIAVGLDCS